MGGERVPWHGEARQGIAKRGSAEQSRAKLGKARDLKIEKEGVMNQELRSNVQVLANDSLSIIRKAILGESGTDASTKEAVKIVALGIRAGQLNQIEKYRESTLALRLIPHLPKDVDKNEYVRITNPQIKSLMETKG